MVIPQWTTDGIIPPIRPGAPGESLDRSPFKVGIKDFVDKFSWSAERRMILEGYLNYRTALHGSGLTSGFQWVDGSFLEDKEKSMGEPPNDLDVVTFFLLPPGATQRDFLTQYPDLFDNMGIKSKYMVDSYYAELGKPLDVSSVSWVSYWYSMWSHRRSDIRWKGFLQLDLDPTDDTTARQLLFAASQGGIS